MRVAVLSALFHIRTVRAPPLLVASKYAHVVIAGDLFDFGLGVRA